MTEAEHVSESEVSGNRADIPAAVRRRLDIDDGDHLRWVYSEDGELRVEVVHREEGTFEEFEGYDGPETDAVDDHDGFGLESRTVSNEGPE